MESTQIPRELLALSLWQSAEQGQAFYASPDYRQVVAGMKVLFLAPPEQFFFNVHISIDASKDATLLTYSNYQDDSAVFNSLTQGGSQAER